MIEKLLKVAFCAICLFIVIGLLHEAWLVGDDNHYGNYVTVVEIEDDGTMVGEDYTGNLWAFKSNTYRCQCGDSVLLVMDDVNTEDITDDVILRIMESVSGGWRYHEVF